MKQVDVIRHVAFEDLGSLAPVLTVHGYAIRYWEAGVDDLAALDPLAAELLVVLGGPIGVYETATYPFLTTEIALLQRRLHQDRPTLGICLGAQLMAAALGANVYPGHYKEIGWSALSASVLDQPLLAPLLTPGVNVLHWHGDTFDLPAGAALLASSNHYPNQAFRWGNNGLALQFHPEVKTSDLERWLIGHACELAHTAHVDVPTLRAASKVHGPVLEQAARVFWQQWLAALA